MSDKKKNMAAQKLEAQKRLFRPSKRIAETGDHATEYEKRKIVVERRKDELVKNFFLYCINKQVGHWYLVFLPVFPSVGCVFTYSPLHNEGKKSVEKKLSVHCTLQDQIYFCSSH